MDEFLNCGECGFARTAKDEIAIVPVPHGADEVIARIATVKEQDCSRTDGSYQAQRLFAFRSMNADHRSGHGKASEHVIGG